MKQTGTRSIAVAALFFSLVLISGAAFAQLYGSNVTGTQGQSVKVNTGGSPFVVNDTAKTGVSISFGSGVSGGSGAQLSVVTQSLSSPPSGSHAPPPNTGPGIYANIVITASSNVNIASGATATVCIVSSAAQPGYNLWIFEKNTQSWIEASSTTVTGDKACGTFLVSQLLDPLVLLAPPAAPDYTLYYVLAIVAVIVVAAVVVLMMRRPKKAAPAA